MTVIAAIATPHHVIVGCDTRTSYGNTGITITDPKITTLHTPTGDRVLIAAAGDASLRPIATRGLVLDGAPDPDNHTDADAWANTIAAAITDAAAEANPAILRQSSENNAGTLDGTLLLAWRHHLWWIFTHTAVRPHGGVLAIGSGTDVALGSLHTAIAASMDPETAVDLAVRLACRHAEGCGLDERGPLIFTTAATE